MTLAASSGVLASAPTRTAGVRIESIDVFRGLTMVVMIFVNDVAGVKGLPWWTYHMPSHVSGMTYVDVVFPAFLFIVGMAIPIAIRRRLELGDSWARLWLHILGRSISLVVLGLILANASKVDPKLTRLPAGIWGALALVGAILFWAVYPKDSRRRRLWVALRYAGLAMLVLMLAVFRRTTPSGEAAWLDFRYWEILGLIGRVYLAACILYVPVRRTLWGPAAIFAGLVALNIASRVGMTPLQRLVPYWLWPFDSGELPSIAFAGIVTHSIFFNQRAAATLRSKSLLAIGFAAVLLAAGRAVASLGISKNAATPSWCLYCSGIGVLAFVAIYWVVDVWGRRAWAAFAKPAGSNTLLTYLLPDLFYFTAGAVYEAATPNRCWPGVVRSVIFTASILAVSWLLTRKRIRLQL